MPSTRHRSRPDASRPSDLPRLRAGHVVALAATLLAAAVGLAGCAGESRSGDSAGAATTTPAGSPTTTAPTATGAVSDNAAWAASRPVPIGFTRIASAELSIGVPDGYQPVQDRQRLGNTDLAATDGSGSVIAARVIPIAEGQTVPDEGAAWAAAGDIAKQAESSGGKGIQITDSDIEQQDGWVVTWVSPKTAAVPALKHIWHLVDIDDKSFAVVSVQAVPARFADGKLAKVGNTLVIRGVTDGTQPSPTASQD